MILVFSGWLHATVVFNHNNFQEACSWVSQQAWWSHATNEIEAYGATLSEYNMNLSGDNGYINVVILEQDEPLVIFT